MLSSQDNHADGTVIWGLTDHQFSVRDLIDNTGADKGHIIYDAFGNIKSDTSQAGLDFLFGYTGREFDEETGLQYNRNRYYDPVNGRFLSEDPSGFAGGEDPNLYRYVGNNPFTNSDPSGLKFLSAAQSLFNSIQGIGSSIAGLVGDILAPGLSNIVRGVTRAFAGPRASNGLSGPVAGSPTTSLLQGYSEINPFRNINLPQVDPVALNKIAAAMPTTSLEDMLAERELHENIGRVTRELNEGWQWKQVKSNLAAVGQIFEGSADIALGAGAIIASGGAASFLGGGAGIAIGIDKIYAAKETLHNGVPQSTYLERTAFNASGGNEYLAAAMLFAIDVRLPGPNVPGVHSFDAAARFGDNFVHTSDAFVHYGDDFVTQADVASGTVVGPYAFLPAPRSVGPGKPFSSSQRKNIFEANREANGGVLRSDKDGIELVPGQKHTRGVSPPANEAQIDHIIARSKGGTNSNANAQILSREQNRRKSDQ